MFFSYPAIIIFVLLFFGSNLPLPSICFFLNCFRFLFCMHWIEGCGVGPHGNGHLKGINRDIVIKWDDMCNDRLQSFVFFPLG